jgi:uncharacterized short protein YbdD (DUF466 family)
MKAAALSAFRGVRWYIRAATGEDKWDQYLDRCRVSGATPMSRRAFERHRADHRESCTQSRCC